MPNLSVQYYCSNAESQQSYRSHLEAFSLAICLSSSCSCNFSLSSFDLFCCSRLEIMALRLLFSRMFSSSPAWFLCLLSSADLYAALDCLTAVIICGVVSTFLISSLHSKWHQIPSLYNKFLRAYCLSASLC